MTKLVRTIRTLLWILLFMLFSISFRPAYAAEFSNIDVFDASRGTVVDTLPNTDTIQSELRMTLSHIKTLSPQASIQFNNKEIVYRIPIQPPIVLHSRNLIEAYIVKMSSNETVLVCFDNHDHSYIYRFDHIIPLLTMLENVHNGVQR